MRLAAPPVAGDAVVVVASVAVAECVVAGPVAGVVVGLAGVARRAAGGLAAGPHRLATGRGPSIFRSGVVGTVCSRWPLRDRRIGGC